MPLYTADALVLRTYKLGEADRIVVFLTADRGKKRGVAKSARRPKSRFVGALEPLTHVRVAYFEKETRELVGLNYAEPLRSPLSGPGESVGHASYFAELLDEWAQADDPNETLFRLGASVLDALAGGVDIDGLARYFGTGCCACKASIRRTWCVTGAAAGLPARARTAPGCRRLTAC